MCLFSDEPIVCVCLSLSLSLSKTQTHMTNQKVELYMYFTPQTVHRENHEDNSHETLPPRKQLIKLQQP